jgi:anti-sigma28 factor (negative regulator of flagellin synthesis)
MRIDDLKDASQSQEAAQTDASQPDAAEDNAPALCNADSDAATISDLVAALGPSDARIEALRLQVERGEYRVSSQDVAGSIIDEHIADDHIIDEHTAVEEQSPGLDTRK